MKLLRLIIGIILLSISHLIFCESISDYDSKITNRNRELQNFENEIKRLRQNIQNRRQTESSLFEQLNQTEHEISLTNKKISTQNEKLELQKNKLKALESKKSYQMIQKENLKERYKNRVKRFYMDYNDDIYSYIFISDNINELFYRLKYFNIINEIDKKLYDEIKFLINDIENKTVQIYDGKKEIVNTINDLKDEDINLKRMKKKRNNSLTKVKKNRLALMESLKHKEESLQKIKGMISKIQKNKQKYLAELKRQRELEARRRKKSYTKGQIPWPVYGRVISKFGREVHPELNTVTENPGIDIQARKGTDVKSVMDGMVTSVTWLRGYGNTVIIFHENGFFTVYSHIDGIRIKENDYVKSGQTIAEVSDSGSIKGDLLHFEIWNAKQNLNPETWLER
ncbi:MAG: peptidoglycan DD-metalloendopeptidase family protein [Candidatus Marinimicrobia bacterium]|jgi:septal ring factor EnvC (AmiA/AmiB activator)|nr:peptidoglycan DD-metalloendopeptidase family protein [Candidatus Neomarinimicrobiota bacterium]